MSIGEVVTHFRTLGLLQNTDNISHDRAQLLLNQAWHNFGNSTPYAEFNIYTDPESASAVLSNPQLAPKTTLLPLDITHQVLATPEILSMVKHGHGQSQNPKTCNANVRPLFYDILTFFAQTYNAEFSMSSPPLHDPLAVAAALCPALFDDNDGERYTVHVVRGRDDVVVPRTRRSAESVGQCGRTVAKMVGKIGNGAEGVRIPRTLRVEVFWWLIEFALEEAEGRMEKEGVMIESLRTGMEGLCGASVRG
jgi:uridine nucleosidase